MNIKSKYKCRYCGEVFDTRNRTENENKTESLMWEKLLTKEEQKHPLRYAMHFAQDYIDNPHIGLGEFIGFETWEEE